MLIMVANFVYIVIRVSAKAFVLDVRTAILLLRNICM